VSTWTPEGAGLEFRGISALSRDAIGDFVQRKLATTCI
jgi:hypothetical protein